MAILLLLRLLLIKLTRLASVDCYIFSGFSTVQYSTLTRAFVNISIICIYIKAKVYDMKNI